MSFFTLDWTKSFIFVGDFRDPATLYIESLIGVHNDVMWFLFLIVTLVYWTLYKILKDSLWTTFSKQIGALRFFYLSPIFINIHAFFFRLSVELYFFPIHFFLNLYEHVQLRFFADNPAGTVENYNYFNNFETFQYFWKFLLFNFDDAIFKDLNSVYWADMSKKGPLAFKEDFVAKYLDHLLYSPTTAGYFYFGRKANYDSDFTYKYSPFLTVQQFKHSTLLEVIWATFPSVIILMILVPSILLIYSIDEDLDPEFTIKVVGHQWFWSYEFDGWLPTAMYDKLFPKVANLVEFSLEDPALYSTFEFDSCMVITDSLKLGERRLLEVDNPLVVPCSIGLRFLVTSADVIHSWAIPSLGIKIDAVPGRLSQYISMIRRPGIFYGQCSEICGIAHGFMPIVIHGYPYTSILPIWTDIKDNA